MIGLDNRSFDDIEVLAEVARIVGKAFAVAGPDVPALSDPAWLTAPPAAKVARLLVIAEANLISNPYEIAAQMVKDGSMAISADGRWSAARALPSHAELVRRRAEPGPLYQPGYTGGPVAWDTSSTSEEESAA